MLAGWTAGHARRTERARPYAHRLIEGLRMSPKTGAALEDELCARLGEVLTGEATGCDDAVEPRHLAEALADAAGVLAEDDAAAQRVRTVVAGVLPADLRPRTGLTPADPPIKEDPLWTCDRTGTRFAVVAAFTVPDGPARWYLWDVDGSGPAPLVAHAGYYASPEEALAAWQLGVGVVAAGGTAWRPIGDGEWLWDLLPEDAEVAEPAEHLRSRRLAEVLLNRLWAPGSGG